MIDQGNQTLTKQISDIYSKDNEILFEIIDFVREEILPNLEENPNNSVDNNNNKSNKNNMPQSQSVILQRSFMWFHHIYSGVSNHFFGFYFYFYFLYFLFWFFGVPKVVSKPKKNKNLKN